MFILGGIRKSPSSVSAQEYLKEVLSNKCVCNNMNMNHKMSFKLDRLHRWER